MRPPGLDGGGSRPRKPRGMGSLAVFVTGDYVRPRYLRFDRAWVVTCLT